MIFSLNFFSLFILISCVLVYIVSTINSGIFLCFEKDILLFIVWSLTATLIWIDSIIAKIENLFLTILSYPLLSIIYLVIIYLISYNIRVLFLTIGTPYFISLLLAFFTALLPGACIISLSIQLSSNIYYNINIELDYFSWLENITGKNVSISIFVITSITCLINCIGLFFCIFLCIFLFIMFGVYYLGRCLY